MSRTGKGSNDHVQLCDTMSGCEEPFRMACNVVSVCVGYAGSIDAGRVKKSKNKGAAAMWAVRLKKTIDSHISQPCPRINRVAFSRTARMAADLT